MSLGEYQVKDDIRYYIHYGSNDNVSPYEGDTNISVEDRYNIPEDYPLVKSARLFKRLYVISNFIKLRKLATYFYVKMVTKQLGYEADIRQVILDEEWSARV